MSSRIDERYRLYIAKWDRIGSKLKKTLIFLFALTIFAQLLKLSSIEGLPPNSTLRLEGKAIIDNLGFTEGTVTLKADKVNTNQSLKVLVNGVEKYIFNKQTITFKVNEADIIEINGIECSDKINITVNNVSDNISIPNVGLNYQVNRNLVYLFRVKMQLM